MKEYAFMKRILAVLCFLLLLAAVSAALGEPAVSVTPENPRVGDYVEIIVTPDRENPESAAYALFYGEEQQKVFSGKGVPRYDVWCRLRKEGTYTLQVTVSYGKKDTETVEVTIPVSGFAPEQEGPDIIYSQKDGWWKKKKYSTTELQTSGCAIFTMSHALQRMGYTGENVLPEKLAKTYVYYRAGEGTWNEGLVRYIAVDYDFTTQKELMKSVKEISTSLRNGDYFSFSIVDRHIALADGISEDGTKVHIVDSAPGATYERIRFPGKIFVRNEDGSFTEADEPEDHPGIRWFCETQEYGGIEYWMDIEYCATRGMRLIRVPWLKADPGDGEGARSVSIEYIGAMVSKVYKDKDSWRIPTAGLQVTGVEPGQVQVALVTSKNGTWLKDADGKQISGKKRIERNTMVLLLQAGEDSLYAWWDDSFGYLTPADVEVLPAVTEPFRTGTIISDNPAVHVIPDRKGPSLQTAKWKKGTPVCIVEEQDGFLLVEAKGRRGWVHEKYISLDQQENTEGSQENGQKIDEGE